MEETGVSWSENLKRDEFLVSRLPRTARELVMLIGIRETRSLLLEYGGTKRYVPKSVSTPSEGWAVISRNALVKLSEVYAGETLELPKPDSIVRAERDYEIFRLTEKGLTRSQLVKRYGLTTRQIGNIRRKYREYIEKCARPERGCESGSVRGKIFSKGA